MPTDDDWIEEARQQIVQSRAVAASNVHPDHPASDDLDAWERLCHWIARHPRRYLAVSALPLDLQGLLGPAGVATRAKWHALHLLPLYEHPRYGWRLAQDWPERLAQLRSLSVPNDVAPEQQGSGQP